MAKGKQKKDSGKQYSSEEIMCLYEYTNANGHFDKYEDGNTYAPYHLEVTGRERSGHALYMCDWRLKEGRYDHILKEYKKI
ncbi:hypothetical protein [Campylobacter curvus]|uniref:hypothetical protein n=1 Tax=Campylobacter curvus TaxID=200 RepID=UPI0014700284|nr:hypothetical protein [Campylobacter curvus]